MRFSNKNPPWATIRRLKTFWILLWIRKDIRLWNYRFSCILHLSVNFYVLRIVKEVNYEYTILYCTSFNKVVIRWPLDMLVLHCDHYRLKGLST
jgi:hypothetical protein